MVGIKTTPWPPREASPRSATFGCQVACLEVQRARFTRDTSRGPVDSLLALGFTFLVCSVAMCVKMYQVHSQLRSSDGMDEPSCYVLMLVPLVSLDLDVDLVCCVAAQRRLSEIVLVNEIVGGAETAGYLLKYDSIHGTW